MIKIKYVDVPQWLQDSIFYRNLSEDEADNDFELPAECFRETDDSVHTIEDVTAVLTAMRFWGVTCIPRNVLQFCYLNEMVIWSPVVAEVLGEGLSEHSALKMAFEVRYKFTLEKSLQTGRSEFVSFWLFQLNAGRVNSDHAIAHACRFGRTELVETLRERGLPWDTFACCAAAQYGHLACLQYLHEEGCPFNEKELIYAARGGQLECTKYLHLHGCPWHEDVTLEYAVPLDRAYRISTRNLDKEQPWSDDWSVAIPANGYLECLRYALENGCPVNIDATLLVARTDCWIACSCCISTVLNGMQKLCL